MMTMGPSAGSGGGGGGSMAVLTTANSAAEAVTPNESVTTSPTVNVPVVAYVCGLELPTPVVPSPNDQLYVYGGVPPDTMAAKTMGNPNDTVAPGSAAMTNGIGAGVGGGGRTVVPSSWPQTAIAPVAPAPGVSVQSPPGQRM